MVKNIQMKLTDKADDIASIYKIKFKLKTKEQAVNLIIENSGVEF